MFINPCFLHCEVDREGEADRSEIWVRIDLIVSFEQLPGGDFLITYNCGSGIREAVFVGVLPACDARFIE